MTKKKQRRAPVVLEHNPAAPIFGDATGGRCYPLKECIQTRLRRLYSAATEEWVSFEHGKEPYARVEMVYQGRLYTGLHDFPKREKFTRQDDFEAAWRDLARQLPSLPLPSPAEEDLEIVVLGAYGWWILHLYGRYGNWACEGTVPMVLLDKLLRCYKRASTPVAYGHATEEP